MRRTGTADQPVNLLVQPALQPPKLAGGDIVIKARQLRLGSLQDNTSARTVQCRCERREGRGRTVVTPHGS